MSGFTGNWHRSAEPFENGSRFRSEREFLCPSSLGLGTYNISLPSHSAHLFFVTDGLTWRKVPCLKCHILMAVDKNCSSAKADHRLITPRNETETMRELKDFFRVRLLDELFIHHSIGSKARD